MLRVRAVAAALYGQAGGGVAGVELGVKPLVQLPGVVDQVVAAVLSENSLQGSRSNDLCLSVCPVYNLHLLTQIFMMLSALDKALSLSPLSQDSKYFLDKVRA